MIANYNYDNDRDIDIAGFIDAERKSAPRILLPIKEGIHNSLEALRKARLIDETVKGQIILMFYFDNDALSKFCILDMATNHTGMTNIESKKQYKLWHHEGIKTGFSEYGIGSKKENLRCCNLIEHHTITNSGKYEMTRWDISRSIEDNRLLDVVSYELEPEYKLLDKYKISEYNTYTLVQCSEILPRLKNSDTSNYIKDTNIGLYKELCEHLVRWDSDNIEIIYKVFENNNEPMIDEIILPGLSNILAFNRKEYELICCKDKINGNYQSFILINENIDDENYVNFNRDELTTLQNCNKNKEAKYGTFYNNQTLDTFQGKLLTTKEIINNGKKSKVELTYKNIIKHYEHKSTLKLICSTDEYDPEESADKFGFYGFREVDGFNVVLTTPQPLRLQWNLFKSHRTRHNQLRCGIQYNRDSDEFLLSDSSKTLSDDRRFEISLRYNLLKLTYDYISSMRKHYDDYNTEKKKIPATTPAPALAPVLEPVIAPVLEPVIAPVLEPVIAPVLEPVIAPVLEPVLEPVVAPVLKPVVAPVLKPVLEPVVAPVLEPVIAPVLEPVLNTTSTDINYTNYTISGQKRKRVTIDAAKTALTIILKKYEEGIMQENIKNLLVDIACHLIGKGGDDDTYLFINDVSVDKLYLHINSIWNLKYDENDNVKMGSKIVDFVEENNLVPT